MPLLAELQQYFKSCGLSHSDQIETHEFIWTLNIDVLLRCYRMYKFTLVFFSFVFLFPCLFCPWPPLFIVETWLTVIFSLQRRCTTCASIVTLQPAGREQTHFMLISFLGLLLLKRPLGTLQVVLGPTSIFYFFSLLTILHLCLWLICTFNSIW